MLGVNADKELGISKLTIDRPACFGPPFSSVAHSRIWGSVLFHGWQLAKFKLQGWTFKVMH